MRLAYARARAWSEKQVLFIIPVCVWPIGSLPTLTTRIRAREGLPALHNPKAYFDAWRSATAGDATDYLRIAVDEAVALLSSGKSREAQEADRRMWLKIANRIGLERFLDAFYQKQSEIRELAERGGRLWNPAASFQKLLNKRFPKGGAR